MKTLSVSLDVISPLAVRSDHAASRAANSEYIPGNTLLGSLATIHRVHRPERIEEFERFFLRDEILYANLYPFPIEAEGIEWIGQGPVYPIPKTAESCKRQKGFLPVKGEDGDAHGVRDSLADWALFKLIASLNRIKALQDYKKCKFDGCGEPLHHFGGYYRRSITDPERLVLTKNETRLQTHTGIDRESGTVREGILYNRQVFEEGSKFWGEIRLPVDEALVEAFNSFLWAVKDSQLLRMGTGRTRGMGKVEINFELKETDIVNDRRADLKQRIEKLDTFIHKTIEKVGVGLEDTKKLDEQLFFALTLHSPVILTDEFTLSQSDRCRGAI